MKSKYRIEYQGKTMTNSAEVAFSRYMFIVERNGKIKKNSE